MHVHDIGKKMFVIHWLHLKIQKSKCLTPPPPVLCLVPRSILNEYLFLLVQFETKIINLQFSARTHHLLLRLPLPPRQPG